MLYLNVPYSEKDEAKAQGAQWDLKRRKWYIKDQADYHKVKRWISEDRSPEFYVICDQIYIISTTQTCFKCNQTTKVLAFGVDHFFCNEDDQWTEWNEDIHLVDQFTPMPKALLDYVRNSFTFKFRYSNTTGITSWSCCCDACDVLQGNHFLFCEPTGPFFLNTEQKIRNLKIERLKLRFDVSFKDIHMYLSTSDPFIKSLAQRINF